MMSPMAYEISVQAGLTRKAERALFAIVGYIGLLTRANLGRIPQDHEVGCSVLNRLGEAHHESPRHSARQRQYALYGPSRRTAGSRSEFDGRERHRLSGGDGAWCLGGPAELSRSDSDTGEKWRRLGQYQPACRRG